MPSHPPPRVLSIQSHVVSGYVGLKAATLPLQLAGFDVDTIPTVSFSNHTGYGRVEGSRLSAQGLAALVTGLDANGLLAACTHVLTGYIGNAEVVRAVGELVKKIKTLNPDVVAIIDPVLGDADRADPVAGTSGLYVPADVPDAYAALLPLADVLTPNAFEAELLTGVRVCDAVSAATAARALHAQGVRTVVVTSVPDGEDAIAMLASTTDGGEDSTTPRVWRARVPRLAGPFTGTGDLFAASLTAGLHTHGGDVRAALLHAAATVQAVCKVTAAAAAAAGAGTARDSASVRARELRLVQCVGVLLDPPLEGVTVERL